MSVSPVLPLSLDSLITPAKAVFLPQTPVHEAIARLREISRAHFVVYVWICDEQGTLLGVVAFRELLFAGPEQPLSSLMSERPFSLNHQMDAQTITREVLSRHYPLYPVCGQDGRLSGEVSGEDLFRDQVERISAQAGSMVGVRDQDRVGLGWVRSLRLRQPWLLISLLTVLMIASVVALFQDAIERLVLLAVFVPVLAGHASNVGCQTLAVTLRGIALGELSQTGVGKHLLSEIWLGVIGAIPIAALAAAAMWALAVMVGSAYATPLALIVALSMLAACSLAGLVGAALPLLLRRVGTDPATASSILLMTLTDMASLGLFLGMATWWLPG